MQQSVGVCLPTFCSKQSLDDPCFGPLETFYFGHVAIFSSFDYLLLVNLTSSFVGSVLFTLPVHIHVLYLHVPLLIL